VARRSSVLAAVVSAASFGTMAIIVRFMYDQGAEPLQVLALRFGMAAILLGGYTALRRRRLLRATPRELLAYGALSLFGYGAASICFFYALRFADASVVAILLYTYPSLIVLAELLFSRVRPTRGRVMAIVMTFAGCVLVVDPFGGSLAVKPVGIVLGVGAGVAYAAFSLMSHRLMETRPRSVIMTYMFGFTSLLATGVALATGAPLVPQGWSLSLWGLLLLLVLIPTFLAIVLYLRAVKALGASQAAILSTFEPVFTLVLAFALLGESLNSAQGLGGTLVLGGVLVAEAHSASVDAAAAV